MERTWHLALLCCTTSPESLVHLGWSLQAGPGVPSQPTWNRLRTHQPRFLIPVCVAVRLGLGTGSSR